MIPIASRRASIACPAVIRAMPSQNAPAPMPSRKRPPDSWSTVAASRARASGGRSGRLVTLPLTAILRVLAAMYVSSVEVSWYDDW